MTAQVVYLLLDTGERAMWTSDRRRTLNRCHRCEWHPSTQGHHPDCPESELAAAADIGTCGCCQQPNVHLVGVDRRGRPACADCCAAPTKEAP